MAIAYQFYDSGHYAGEVEDYGLLPNNATYVSPPLRPGFMPQWDGHQWEQVENHIGEAGYRDGQPFTIVEYGPYPEGWSATPPLPTSEALASGIRGERDRLLAETDYVVMPDYPCSEAMKQAVASYRQALRDLTDQPGFPEEIQWPLRPALG